MQDCGAPQEGKRAGRSDNGEGKTRSLALDRHCQQGLRNGYSIADDIPFSRVLDHATAVEREYKTRDGEIKTVCHWGQRKLMLSEVEFLTKFYEQASVVVYAGAAPGTHIVYLAQLFPKLRFVLVDPRPFSSQVLKAQKDLLFDSPPVPRIQIREGFFTDEMAEEFSKERGVLFISDVRTSDDHDVGIDAKHRRKAGTQERASSATTTSQTVCSDEIKTSVVYPTQQYVQNDMELQQAWHVLMQPVASSFKFRLPWDDGVTCYLKGDIYLPVWGGPTTTECRLFVETCAGSSSSGPDTKTTKEAQVERYDNRKYERQMFYFNTHRRIAKYEHSFMEFYKCCCFDCTSEASILASYLTVMKQSMADPKDVPELSRRLDRECHRDYQNPRTLFDANPDPVERKQRILKRQRRT